MRRSRPSPQNAEPPRERSRLATPARAEPDGALVACTSEIIDRLRRDRPRVHCITNTVAQAFSANMLLAVGAIPSMTIASEEIADFVAASDALLVNLGTFDAERREAIHLAVKSARDARIPWLLDPTFIERSPHRADHARELVAKGPTGVRLNRSEFRALAAAGADPENLTRYARHARTVLGLTGDVDFVSDGERLARIENGHALMGSVTAMGCAESALVAACLAVEADAFVAIAAGLTALGVAGEIAAQRAQGPGSFAAAILDAVYALDGPTLRASARVA